MKTYFFNGYLMNGSGSIISLEDWSFDSDDHYLSDRPLKDFYSVRYLMDKDHPGMWILEVRARSLKEAFYFLCTAMSLNLLNFVYSNRYECISNGKKSVRYFRSSH